MSSKLLHSVKAIKEFFDAGSVRYCLVGGLAVSVRVGERTTKDIDFAISVASEKQAEDTIRYLLDCGLKLETLLEHKNSGLMSTVRLKYIDGPNYFIDLLFSASGIEQEIVDLSSDVELLPGFYLPVATVPALLVMKLISADSERRPTDVADINLLVSSLTKEQDLSARELIKLVVSRGFNRGRDLEKMLNDKLAQV
jgi:predicted nucleotidyltransferase